ncbi:PGF-pre-PGF domain-containing protein [uncultured Methanomethylovorans sp.]|uniref:PGF-pre-PGF domain-containing protein n=1 Tax=uncultured Methanomethylovorans sp. TaxID=183759 RepID=UPI003748F104
MRINLTRLICVFIVLLSSFLVTTGISSAIPHFAPMDDHQFVGENELLIIPLSATDDDINAIITYSAVNVPEGATFDSNTHTFSWTPTAGSAGDYYVTFLAVYNYQDSETIRITVIAVKKNDLMAVIDSANIKIASAVTGIEIGQYPQAATDTFRTVITTAQTVVDNTGATQAQVDQALNDLKAAEMTFDAAKITFIDKSALTTAIAASNVKVANAVPGFGVGQYPQTAIDAFVTAIATAQVVVDNAGATQAEVNQAVTSLKEVQVSFDAARQSLPASVTNLKQTSIGTSWITWEWTNPTDADFSHVMVFIDGAFITNTSNDYYNLTGLAENTLYTIGIKTVDASGNINHTTISSQATTKIIDRTPPGPVMNIQETGVGASWIYWTWTNPTDADFSYVRVYIDGIFDTTTSNNYYNATGLSDGIEHTISTETVDTSENINNLQVSDSATTLKLPKILNVAGKSIKFTSITLEWEASENTAMVQIRYNGTFLDNVTESTYIHLDLNSSTTYNYTLIPYSENGLKGEAVNISLTTSSSSSGGGSGGGSSSSSKSSGGGGAGSAEDFVNVALKDVDSEYLRMNNNVTYEFKREGNPIQSVSFYSIKNSGEIASTIEVLNNRSKFANSTCEGSVYKYINIWVGKNGFATSDNIMDARIQFKVNNSWIEEMGISTNSIILQRYNGTAWQVLPTVLEENTTNYAIFEAQTPGFSPFVITAEKTLASSIKEDTEENSVDTEDIVQNNKTNALIIWVVVFSVLFAGIYGVGSEYVKWLKK